MAENELVEDNRKIREVIEKDPNLKALMQHNAEENRRSYVKMMLEQQHECRCANFRVRREANVVIIEWEMKPGHSIEYALVGKIHDINFVPAPDNVGGNFIVYGNDQKFVRLELEEGHSYLFEFHFMEEERFQNLQSGTGDTRCLIEMITFQVAIPLSDGRKLKQQPAKRLESEMVKYLQVDDAFDSMCKIATEHIRSKNLSPDDEQDRIERFKARAGFLKTELGM